MIYKNILLGLLYFFNIICFAATSDSSLYRSPTKWIDDKSNNFSLSELQGKKVIMAMAYTSCQGTCPMIVSKLKKIESHFNQKNIKIEIVIITFDPGFDTPERNASFYREKMGIKKENWHFLTGSENETRKMSMLLGIKYAVNPISKAIIHDNKIILINESGEIEKKLDSLEDDEKLLLN